MPTARFALLLWVLALAACGGSPPEEYSFWVGEKAVSLTRAEAVGKIRSGEFGDQTMIQADGKWVLLAQDPKGAALLAEARGATAAGPTAAPSSASPEGTVAYLFTRHDRSQHGISIAVPKGWIPGRELNMGVMDAYSFCPPADNPQDPAVFLVVCAFDLGEGETLDSFYADQIRGSRARNHAVTEGERTTIAGEPARVYRQTFRTAHRKTFSSVDFAVVHGRKGFDIAYSARSDLFERDLGRAETAIRAFAFTR